MSYLYVLSVPYVAALSSISGGSAWGFQYTGFIWSFMLVVGVLLILQRRKAIAFPWKVWCPWFGYVLLSLIWGGIHGLHSLQDPAQMIAPLVVGMVASYAVQTESQLERLMRGFIHCLLFVAAVFVFFWYGPGSPYQAPGSGYSARPAAMTVAFIACLFVSRAQKNAVRSALGWTACLAITFFSGSRMATMVVLILWSASPLYRRLRSRILVSAVMCVAGLAIFYSPVFQERFFASEQGSLQQVLEGDYSGSGRFELWPIAWEEAQKNLVFGAGAGEAESFAAKARLSEPTPLNDYLQVILEYGAMGLLIFICTVVKQIHILHKLIRTSNIAVVWASGAACLGFIALLIFAWTENALIYGVHFMHPLFAVTGAAIGLRARSLRLSRSAVATRSHFAFPGEHNENEPWHSPAGQDVSSVATT